MLPGDGKVPCNWVQIMKTSPASLNPQLWPGYACQGLRDGVICNQFMIYNLLQPDHGRVATWYSDRISVTNIGMATGSFGGIWAWETATWEGAWQPGGPVLAFQFLGLDWPGALSQPQLLVCPKSPPFATLLLPIPLPQVGST